MRKIVFFILPLLFTVSLNIQSQNLIYNHDFEASGGSFDGWEIASGTDLMDDAGDHYAYLHAENGVLLQKVSSVVPGNTYLCRIYLKYLFVKQTTGYGFAVEYDNPLFIPEFTIGATNLKSFCNDNNGVWFGLPNSYTATNVIESYSVEVPDDATSVYIAIGTKGAVAKYEIDSVSLVEMETTGVTITVLDKSSREAIENAEIHVDGSSVSYFTNASGVQELELIPGNQQIEIIANWYTPFDTTLSVTDQPSVVEILLDSVREVKKVKTRISKYGDNATPYPLFGHFWNSGFSFSNEMINTITASLDYIIGGAGIDDSKSISDKLHAADPAFQVIKYQGKWATSRSKGENMKSQLPYYRCGILSGAITETNNSFTVNTTPDGKGLGLVASEDGNFITWLRIDDELMKIVSVSSSTNYPITVTVERGLDNSIVATHSQGAAVTAPLYSSPPVPGGNNSGISYFGTVYNVRHLDLENNLYNYATNSHIDGIWIDILVGWLNAQNMLGGNYTLWNHQKDQVLSSADNIQFTKESIQEMFIGFYSKLGYYPVIYGNNVLYSNTFNSSDRGYMMLETEVHQKVIDGFCHETSWGHMTDNSGSIDNDGNPVVTADKFIVVGGNGHFLQWFMGNTWIRNCQAIALLAQRGLPNQPMTINAGFKNQWFAEDLTDETRYDFNKYCYASYLMSVEVDEDSLISCRMGISPQVKKGSSVSVEFQSYFYYDIGIPIESENYNNFENYRVGTNNLYARRFSNGLVLMNPFKDDMTDSVEISAITGNTDLYIDAESELDSTVVSSVRLKSRQTMLLLYGYPSEDSATTSITQEVRGSQIAIYPVPSQSSVSIKLPDTQGNGLKQVRMINITGTVTIIELQFHNGLATMDISGVSLGLYFLKVEGYESLGKLVVIE